MNQQNLFEPIPLDRFQVLSHEELLEFVKLQQKVNEQIIRENQRLRALSEELKEKTFLIEDQYIVLRNKVFGKSSEKEGRPASASDGDGSGKEKEPKPKRRKVQLPSERYPDATRIERHIEFKDVPDCKCCGDKLKDSGMTEDSEYLTVIPKQYIVIQQKRHKYGCDKCHGDIQTAPAPPRIKDGSAYSDEMMVDVVMTKYCDLIPVERYTKIAERSGVPDLPPQSLIESTHYVADFIRPAYWLLKDEILANKVLNADETPHRMLEGDDKSNWYLWGFSSTKSSYFEAHDTRSGDVASSFLKDSACEYLVSDVYSGYGKAVREANQWRLESESGLPPIKNIYCNAHSRRRFKEAHDRFPEEAQFFIDQYKEIYRLEALTVDKPPDEILRIRWQMSPYFEDMREKGMELIPAYSTKSSLAKAMNYFLRNFKELTAFLGNAAIPIDNNSQERLLRNPVIGRKTWYGTHSKRGAETMAILFSIVESCKLNGVNPREYLKCL
ncbi:MAG: IS66 family transposase, partial [Bdellovibrionota bacterium]